MSLLTFFSGALFVLPITITGGIYLGVSHQKVINAVQGKPPPGTTSTGAQRVIETDTYCQKAFGIEPFPYRYIYNPNQWGDPQNTGALCFNITTDNGVSATDLNAFNWTATWSYPQVPDGGQPVHAFPNALLNDTQLPIQVSDINSLTIDVNWNYAIGDLATTTTDDNGLDAAKLNANVALDMFLSNDQTKAANSTLAEHEVMVWLGKYGSSTDPLGLNKGALLTAEIDQVTFSLYYDINPGTQQGVFTWLAPQNTTSFNGDISQLISGLSTLPNSPQPGAYLGYVAFGSETFYSPQNVTLSVQTLSISINGK